MSGVLVCSLSLSLSDRVRIRERARGCETGITIEYLRLLYAGYETFLHDIAKVIPVIRVKYDKYRTGEEVAKVVMEKWRQHQNIQVVDFNAPSAGEGVPVDSPSKNLAVRD